MEAAMSHGRIGAMALVLGAAAGAVAGAALIISPPAYATDPPPVPSFFDFVPPGEMGNPTNVEDSSFPYLYNFFQENNPYTIYDQTNHVVGTYDTQETGGIVGLLPLLGFSHDYQVVTDSTGAAPMSERCGTVPLSPRWRCPALHRRSLRILL